jgi:hypothetical protein
MSVRDDCVTAISRLEHELQRADVQYGPEPDDIVEMALTLAFNSFARTMDTLKHEYPDKGKSVLLWWNGLLGAHARRPDSSISTLTHTPK